MASLSVSTPSAELSMALYEELGASIRGDVHLRDSPSFQDYSLMFNGNVKTPAKAVACPLNAEDVSKIILFCSKHSLSPSVKAGGYGTAGWAVNGDIIIDLSNLVEVDIEPPQQGGSFISLRDMPPPGSKGKGKVGPTVTDAFSVNSGKRRRENDAHLRVYDPASPAVASFLHGPSLEHDGIDAPRPTVRRRLDVDALQVSLDTESSQDSSISDMSTGATSPSPPNSASGKEAPPASSADPFAYLGEQRGGSSATSISPPPPISSSGDRHPPSVSTLSGGDPFGYLSGSPSSGNFPPAPPPTTVQSAYPHPSTFNSWGTAPSIFFANPSLPALTQGLLTRAEPIHSHAYVTFGAGMRQKEIDRYTAANPLVATSLSGMPGVIPYHVPFSAHPVGSSIMLLGGFGFLGRLHGLSIDSLVEVEMVLADGTTVIVSENEHPDLWWAIRGAGSAFGVATRYKARAFPVPVVFAGNLLYRFHRATAPSLIKHFRDCVKGAPRELYANVILTAGPANEDSLIVIQMCYIGPKERGQEYLQAISSWDGERCLLNEVDEKSFLHQQDSVAQVLRGKAGRQWFIRSALITSLPDDIINTTVIQFADTPVGCTWLFELAGGAIADFEDTCFPKAQREASFTIAALHQWDMGVDDPRCISSAEEWIADTLKPVNTGGPFPCFLGRHEPAARTISCYGDNWSRLVELKKKYDPKGLFRNSLWPLDTEGNTIDPHVHEPLTP